MKTYFLTILTGLFILTACNGDDDNAPEPFVPQEIESELVAKDDNLRCHDVYDSHCIPEQYTVFYSESEWDTFLGYLREYTINTFEETEIDFDTYTVIVVIDRLYGSGPIEIDITNITEYEDKIVVNVQKNNPGFYSVVLQPFHIVKIPKSDKPVEFVVAEP